MNQPRPQKMTQHQRPKQIRQQRFFFHIRLWFSILIGCLLCITSYGQIATKNQEPLADENSKPEMTATAPIAYISDSLPVKLYSRPLLSPTENISVLGEVAQGDAVTLLETHENQIWAKIKTASGLEGWLKKEWIQTQRSHRAQVGELQTQLTQIQNALLEKNQRIHTLQQEIMQLKNEAVGDALPNMTATHTLHPLLPNQAPPILMGESEIHKQLETSRILNEELKLENHVLRENQYTQGLIHGTISLLLGVLLTLALPKIKPKKRHENWGEYSIK